MQVERFRTESIQLRLNVGLATEVPGEQKPAVVVLDEDIADLGREAQEAGLVVLVDGDIRWPMHATLL